MNKKLYQVLPAQCVVFKLFLTAIMQRWSRNKARRLVHEWRCFKCFASCLELQFISVLCVGMFRAGSQCFAQHRYNVFSETSLLKSQAL